MNPKYAFQYCQKLVLFSLDREKIFLAKRKGEDDYDGTFSYIGGKMETSDKSILEGLKREKNEEIGAEAKIKVYLLSTCNTLFTKKDGNQMILPFYLAHYIAGPIKLNEEEYSTYKWVPVKDFELFEPKIQNDVKVLKWALDLAKTVSEDDFVEI